jgi:beta-keto acid cleavage enzyme
VGALYRTRSERRRHLLVAEHEAEVGWVGVSASSTKAEGCPSNEELVRRAATIIEAMGHEVGSVDDARQLLEI